MSCCLAGTAQQPGAFDRTTGHPGRDEVLFASRAVGDGLVETHLSVPDIHCGACIRSIERAMDAIPGIAAARVNLSAKRLVIHWRRAEADPDAVFAALDRLGYTAHLSDGAEAAQDATLRRLLLSLGVAGFAAGNIMLLSVSVWSGAEGTTRDLFHWISALIAIPAVGYAGQPFFRPALRALKARRLTMDVPISLAVVLAIGMSVYETWHHGEAAYFDASVTLLFFLLIGRTLDHVMRVRARGAVASLGRLAPNGATVVGVDGARQWRTLEEIEPGMTLIVAAGERLPVDGEVIEGAGEVDCAIATGESAPVAAGPGKRFPAGAMALGAPLVIEALKPARQSFLAEMVAMLEAAESANPSFRRLSDRAAAIYAPAVHLAALATFVGWVVATGDWHHAIYTAIAVLIITCPCALGLAVPIVQVVAAGRLSKRGILVSDGAALEKLAETDRVLFDKTGTLTHGTPVLIDVDGCDPTVLADAAALARMSRHPYSRALVAAAEARGLTPRPNGWQTVREVPGMGIEAVREGTAYRLGRPRWALAAPGAAEGGVVFARAGRQMARYRFSDAPRPGAAETVRTLAAWGYRPAVISGDAPAAVAATARALGLTDVAGGLDPAAKIARIRALQAQGHKVLMVGDGINDAPALSAADASIAPATAADVGRRAAGFVFLHPGLDAVTDAIAVARGARRLIRQNFGLAVVYNLIAVPLAVAGFATPLVAALAMSLSSLLVIGNALRLARPGGGGAGTANGLVASAVEEAASTVAPTSMAGAAARTDRVAA